MLPVASEPKSKAIDQPRVLIVDDEPGLLDVIGDVLSHEVDCKIILASTLAQARKILASGPVEVMITDVYLPDGDGMTLLPELREHQPHASAIVMTGNPSMDRAITAIRGGAIDFVPKPFSNEQLINRVRSGIVRHTQLVKREKRIERLRDTVKRLNDSRKLISKKVDLLCNDLVSAYGDLSKQLEGIRYQEGFRKYVSNAKDLEQLLCHSMDWLLREMGYANVAVYLAADDGVFQLGAYMKYTIAGDAVVTDALRRVVIPVAVQKSIVRVNTGSLGDRLNAKEAELLKGQELIAVNCTYLGESLASLLFFRDAKSPFSDDDVELLKQVSPIFAVELATIVREAQPTDTGDFENDLGVEDFDIKPKRRPKKDPADWWKNGEDAPY